MRISTLASPVVELILSQENRVQDQRRRAALLPAQCVRLFVLVVVRGNERRHAADVQEALGGRDVFGGGGPSDADEGQPGQDGAEPADLQEGGGEHGLRRAGRGARGPGSVITSGHKCQKIWSQMAKTPGHNC